MAENPVRFLHASTLYAASQGAPLPPADCDECHYCAGPAPRGLWPHDDPPPVPFARTLTVARRPSNAYVCTGCHLWKYKSVSVRTLDGRMRDRQTPRDHSWYVTEAGAWAVRPENYDLLYEHLRRPPRRFFLSLLRPEGKVKNLLQLCAVNDLDEVKADTPLAFTLDNVAHRYTVYELTEAVKAGDPTGAEPGVRVLFELLDLGRFTPPAKAEPEKKKRGRPEALPTGAVTQQVIVASGS